MYDKNSLKNCILRAIHNKKIGFYFDNDGFYRQISAEEAYAIGLKGALQRDNGECIVYPWYIALPNGRYASQRAQIVMGTFPIGGTLDDFLDQWDKTMVVFRGPMSEIERFMARIERPDIIRFPENQNPNTR